MEKNAIELQRVKRRYKALMREHATLCASSGSDPLVRDEIRKLEERYPELLVPAELTSKREDICTSAPRSSEDSVCDPTSNPETAAQPEPQSALFSPTDAFPSHTRLRKSAPPSLVRQPEPPLAPQTPQLEKADPPQSSGSSCPPQSKLKEFHLMMIALQLYNETHQKSLMTKTSLVIIAALSVAIALAHCTIVDPATIAGSLLSPSLLTLLVHANFLCGLYMRRRRRFTAAMMIVYTVLDVIPSLGLCIVCYNIGLIALELHGFRRASFAC